MAMTTFIPYIILLAGLGNLCLGLIISRKAQPVFFNQYFAFFSYLTALWCFSNYALATTPTLFWFQSAYALGALVLSNAIVWVSGFRHKKISVLSIMIFNGIGISLAAACYVDNWLVTKLIMVGAGHQGVPGPLMPVYGLYMLIFLFVLPIKLYRQKKHLSSHQEKLRMLYIFWGTMGFAVNTFVVSFVFPLFGYAKLSLLDSPSSIVFIGAVTIAIIRYNLMNINIIVKKTAIYTILTTLISCIYIAIILIFESLFQTLTGITSLAIRILAALIIAISFQPLRSRVEIIIDKLFFRGKLDYQETIAEFTRSLVTILDLRELLNLIVSMSSILNIKQIAILLFDEDSIRYRIRASAGLDQETKEREFDEQSDLIRLLTFSKKAVQRSKIENASANSDYTKLLAEMDMVKAAIAIPIFVKGNLKGVLLLGEKLSEEQYNKEDVNMLTTLADEAGIAIDNAQLYETQKKTYLETVQALAQAIEASDEYTRGHSDRVTKIAIQIARELKLGRTLIDVLKIACILHDVGKIGIIKEVLNKPGKLNDSEFNIIRMHPALGEQIITPVAFLTPIRPIVRHHHERFDGRGYPDGLKGENIPYLSRIIAVADTYDAMTSERPYRPALSEDIALAEIRKCSGTQFDPEVVKAFLEIHPTLQL